MKLLNSMFCSLKPPHQRQIYRTIYSRTKIWPDELTIDVKKDIEKQWKEKLNDPIPTDERAEKFYLLSMFPYPSGNLHMGHVRVYTISDSIARFLRMNGKKVIHPIGWDAFGLPAENAAIEKNVLPFEWTYSNINTMKKQLKDLNLSFDWDMELATCDPSYYKWTQYLFLLMHEKGFAYKKKSLVNWDPIDQTVLADEQVDENGLSWRSGCKVEKRRLSQWFLSTSAFSKSLYEGLNDPSLVEWRDAKKIQQHWIGEPNGFIIHFNIFKDKGLLDHTLPVWTDAPELIYGAFFIGISPDNHFSDAEYGYRDDIKDYKLNITAIHPLTGEKLPIFVTDNLDHSSATDSCLGIPDIKNEKMANFISSNGIKTFDVLDSSLQCLLNSKEFSGLDRKTAREKILDKLKSKNIKIYPASGKLRDWLISRQRYWGTPIPIINCPKCGQTKKDNLPHDKKYHIKRENSKRRLTPKGKKNDGKAPVVCSPGGPDAVRSPSFGVVGYTRFNLQNCHRKTFTLDKVPFTSPLEGVLRVQLRLHAEHKVTFKGFLTFYEDVGHVGALYRRWCVLNSSHISYWLYPEDCEKKKEPLGVIDLRQCVTGTVKSVPPLECARPHTFKLVTVRPQKKGDKDTLISRTVNTLTTTKYLLTADSKDERILWCNKINEALEKLRKWDSKALRPIESINI